MSFVESREFPVRRGLCFPCIFGSILLQWRQKRGKPMWIKKITWHRGKCGGTDSECVCDSDDRGAVSSSGNDGGACERDDYAFFHDVAGVLFRGRGIQPEERPGAYVCGERNKVIIQSPISIPLTLHLDVASRHMKFQKKLLIHASMIRNFFFHFAWL